MLPTLPTKQPKFKGRVLFAGQAYYHCWYLSRELRKIGWQADVLNWETDPNNERFYHGEDYLFDYQQPNAMQTQIEFYFWALDYYDIFHFNNKGRMSFGPLVSQYFASQGYAPNTELDLIKERGKKIVYSNNGCLDGRLLSSFQMWTTPESICELCPAKSNPGVCSDALNHDWGVLRNHYADYQIDCTGNRQDFNSHPSVHQVPEFYNMSDELWSPEIEIPREHQLDIPPDTFKIFHAVGNFKIRTLEGNRNIKSSHIWLPLIERLKSEGYKVELIFCHDKPSTAVRYYQAQADMIGEMLSYGMYGSTGREAMMLGKPVVCYMRPEWLTCMANEEPNFVRELPIVQANPDTVYEVVVDLIKNPEKRIAIGKKSREFALRWHSSKAGAKRMDEIYSGLLGIGDNNEVATVRYSTLMKYGEADLLAGNYESAKSNYEKVVSQFPNSLTPIKGLATALYYLGQIETAMQLICRLQSQDPDTVILSAQCAESTKDYQLAKNLFQAVLTFDQLHPQALAGLKRMNQLSSS